MEQLLILLVLILIPLANFLLDRMRRRYESRPPERHPADMGMRRAPLPPSTTRAVRTPVAEAAPPTVVQRPVRKRATAKLFRSRNEIRRAIIAMTVLGPCRAEEPRD